MNAPRHPRARPRLSHLSRPSPASLLPALVLAVCVAGCDGGGSASNVRAPGAETSPTTKALDAGAAALQNRAPIEAINAYLDGFHFYAGRMEEQMEAHHYCAILNEDVIQCVIYDGNVKDAKLMGVEYIVTERLFKDLPDAEKALWHSHVHEVKSGQLVAPGIPQVAENELMKKLVGTYGKTWHTWHTDRQKTLPLGVPQLMMGFTADGQVHADMVEARDRRMGIRSADKKQERESIAAPAIAPGADAWKNGGAVQLRDPTGQEHHGQGSPGAQGHRDGQAVQAGTAGNAPQGGHAGHGGK
ncbi:MAG TPA: OBAP family protein [Variovorax sp.]|nr:OBAP family protein [Variovorax sp.]